MREAH